MSQLTAGSVVVLRDEEWLIRSLLETEHSGARLEVTGVSELVRDQDATFYTGLEEPGSVQVLDPNEVRLVPDDTPGFRRSRLWLESLIRRTPRPATDTRITVGHRALLDRMDYQLRPAAQAMQNLRPRILIGDAVGLGKTLEIGILLSELMRRGRAERVLVVTPRAVLEQFQHEMWTRFAIPLVRLDSEGIQRVRQTLPASRNPFSYYRRVICSIDTLKNPARYRHHLDQQRWDVVVIDECHALMNRATQKSELANLLAAQTDALILASATPHNGEPESFAELVNLLDPTAITDPGEYDAKDIEHLYVRRHRNSSDVAADVAHKWKQRREPHIVPVRPTAAEEAVLTELKETWLHPTAGGNPVAGRGRSLFPWTLFKAFLSSPRAMRATVVRRLGNLDRGADPAAMGEAAALRTLDHLVQTVEKEQPSKLQALLRHLAEIGVGAGSDRRVVVFSERIDTLLWLRDELRDQLNLPPTVVRLLHAQLPDRDVQQTVEDFALEGSDVRVLLASDMASEGLNLHRQCHHLVHFDLPWSFIRIQQRNGRIDRYLQLHEPRITALALTSADPEVDSDLRVVTKLLRKEYAANKALGDAGVLLDVHDEDIEEDKVRAILARGQDIDEAVPEPEPEQLNPFAAAMATGGAHAADPVPEIAPLRTLFDDEDNLLAEALDEIIDAHPARVRAFDLHRDEDDDLIAFNTPEDLVLRLRDLPAEYLRDQRVAERIRLTASRRVAEDRLAAARRGGTTTWPDVHFLSALHPVVEWATGRALARFGRNQAPVLSGDVPGPVFLTQASWANALGQPILAHWGAVHGVPESARVEDMLQFLDVAGIKERSINPGIDQQAAARLQPLVPAAVGAAAHDLQRRRRGVADDLTQRLERARAHVEQWQRQALDVVDQAAIGRTTRQRRASIVHDAHELGRLIDDLAPAGDPFIRVVAVVVPGTTWGVSAGV